MGTYLQDNPPRRSQFRVGRRQLVSGVIVVHTAESAPDTSGPDTGAENVARFIRNRTDPGSYHSLCDSDSRVRMVPFEWEAYHDGTGSNPHSIGISAATQAAKWPNLDPQWIDKTITNMALEAAEAALFVRQARGIEVPARRISKAQSDRKEPGFISHGERDPGRRSDPGAKFPWDRFLERYAYFAAMNGIGGPPVAEAPPFTGTLLPGQFVKSGSGRYTLIHQTDGNVVLYEDMLRPVWSTGTNGKRTTLFVMQGDGNLVLYSGQAPLWASGTHGKPGSALRLQNDGNMVIYAPGNKAIWSRRG